MPANFDHVTWLGGSPCSGKSTIAALLADCHWRCRYDCDAAFDAHLRRATPDAQPHLHHLTHLDWTRSGCGRSTY